MNILLKIGACFMTAGLATVAYAQSNAAKEDQSKKDQSFTKASVEALVTSLAKNRETRLFGGTTQTCTIANDKDLCPVTLTVQPLFDANNNLVACAAAIGEITIKFGSNPAKDKRAVIHWTISAAGSSPPSATYGFDTTYGLIILQDNDGATNKKADPSSTATDLYLTYKFKHHPNSNNSNQQALIYYPLVFQSVVGSPAPSLCASADPRIVNN